MEIILVSRLYQITLTHRQRKKLKAEDVSAEEFFALITEHMDDHARSCITALRVGDIAGEQNEGLIVEVTHNDFDGFSGFEYITPTFIIENVAESLAKALK